MKIKKIRGNEAVSEIIGTILLLVIAIIIFSGLIIYVLSSTNVSPSSPNLNLIGYVGENGRDIIIEHRGGESLDLNNIKMIISKGNVEDITVKFDSHGTPSNGIFNGGNKWQVGNYFNYSFSKSIRHWQVSVIIIDQHSNSIIMSGVLNMGLTDYIFTNNTELQGVANFTWTKPATTTIPTQFTDCSSYLAYIDIWNWNLGDGNISNEQNPLHSYAVTDTYSVTLEIGYNQTVLGPDVTINNDTVIKQVDVYQSPVADFTWNISVPQILELVRFTAIGSSPTMLGASSASITRYYWDWDGDGIYDHDDASPVDNNAWTTPGTYAVTLKITSPMNGYAFNDTVAHNIRVNAPPIADFTWNPLNPTYLDMINFTDTSSDSDGTIVNWTWNFDDGNISYDQNPSHNYPIKGTYNVSLTVMDNDNAINTAIKQINVTRVPPVADFVYYPPSPETNVPIAFTDISYDLDGFIVNWSWDFDDGNISYLQHPSKIYKMNGTYMVSLIVTDDEGLTDVEVKAVVVNWREIWVNETWKGCEYGEEVAPGKFFLINAFDKINEGVDAAFDGESVFVFNGNYEFTGSHFIDMDAKITLFGESKNGVTCYGTGNHPIMIISADYSIVKNFSFFWNSQTTSAVRLNANNILFENCYIETSRDGIRFGDVTFNNIVLNVTVTKCDYGIRVEDSSGHVIQNTTVFQCDNIGIYLAGASTIIIENCHISNTLQHAIHITRGSNNIIISGNTICENVENGVLIEDSDMIMLINNTLHNNSDGIYLYRALFNNISLNNIYWNNEGISLEGTNQEQTKINVITNNTIHNNNYGVKFETYAIENYFTYNTIHNNSIYGVEIPFENNKENDDNAFHHNNFMDNTVNAYDECSNSWDDGISEGNYWDDYIGPGPYVILPGVNSDDYPLAGPV